MFWHKELRAAGRWCVAGLLLVAGAAAGARAQDSADNLSIRGDRAEISVSVKDSSGELIRTAGNAKLLREGILTDQSAISHGRVFFLCRLLGNYTVVIDAAGYKSAQRDINIPVAVKYELDVTLQRETAGNEVTNVPGKPVLAPKAKEAFDKALKALEANKLDEAESQLNEALRLAPAHPDVLFVQGVLQLTRRRWSEAQATLEKVTQLDPNNQRAFSALGMALSSQNKYAEAVPMFEKAVQLDPPGSWETNWSLGKAYYYHEQYQDALKTSQLALSESKGQAPQIELLVAQSLTAVGRYEDAAQALRNFLKKNADRPEATTAKRWLDGLAKNGKIRSN
jgi:tetratricopeptide (TPR) repeat protein